MRSMRLGMIVLMSSTVACGSSFPRDDAEAGVMRIDAGSSDAGAERDGGLMDARDERRDGGPRDSGAADAAPDAGPPCGAPAILEPDALRAMAPFTGADDTDTTTASCDVDFSVDCRCEGQLVTIEDVFAEQHEKLLENDILDLDVQMEVLSAQLKREGVV